MTSEDSPSIQYLGGLEPDSKKILDQAVHEFKFKCKIKDDCDVEVRELPVTGKSGSNKKGYLAHRYKIVIIMGEDKIRIPTKKDEYLTKNGTISMLDSLAALWGLIRTYRTKKAIENKKRISHLQKIADADAKKISNW